MVKAIHLSLPWKLVSIHSTLILLFMFTLWRRWFLLDIPFDDFYAPFFFTSGPIVYFVAWWLQHWSEPLFPTGSIRNGVLEPDSRMRVSAAWREFSGIGSLGCGCGPGDLVLLDL